jgi:hypothetical protein
VLAAGLDELEKIEAVELNARFGRVMVEAACGTAHCSHPSDELPSSVDERRHRMILWNGAREIGRDLTAEDIVGSHGSGFVCFEIGLRNEDAPRD